MDKDGKITHVFAILWAKIIVALNPMWRVKIMGRENIKKNQAYIIVSNHQSFGDSIIGYLLNMNFKWISKDSVFKVPIMGWGMRMAKYIPLKRGNKESIIKCLQLSKMWLTRNWSVFFFAEGTRSPDGKIGEFKSGAVRLSLDTNYPILPITIHGTRDVIPKGGFLFNKALVSVIISQPIKADVLKNLTQDKANSYVRDIIVRNYEKLNSFFFFAFICSYNVFFKFFIQ
jgi:1-acyl-sn-glycerol-3-phosphate acyltransferase